MAINTQFNRGALLLKRVCLIDIHTRIDNLPGAGTYDIYIYHGCLNKCKIGNTTRINVIVDGQKNQSKGVDIVQLNKNSGELIR